MRGKVQRDTMQSPINAKLQQNRRIVRGHCILYRIYTVHLFSHHTHFITPFPLSTSLVL